MPLDARAKGKQHAFLRCAQIKTVRGMQKPTSAQTNLHPQQFGCVLDPPEPKWYPRKNILRTWTVLFVRVRGLLQQLRPENNHTIYSTVYIYSSVHIYGSTPKSLMKQSPGNQIGPGWAWDKAGPSNELFGPRKTDPWNAEHTSNGGSPKALFQIFAYFGGRHAKIEKLEIDGTSHNYM